MEEKTTVRSVPDGSDKYSQGGMAGLVPDSKQSENAGDKFQVQNRSKQNTLNSESL